jgi:hypothetical protein
MTWKLDYIHWHKFGDCWTWSKITKGVFYAGNQVVWRWGRIAFVFERRVWL